MTPSKKILTEQQGARKVSDTGTELESKET